MNRLPAGFYERDVLQVAPELLGKYLSVNNSALSGNYKIIEVEAYRGEEDLACHASKGRTKRTEIMYQNGGHLYVYLIYGMYWMLNIVTGKPGDPQAVLIRGIEKISGPGRVSRFLGIDAGYYGENLVNSQRLWLSDNKEIINYLATPRIGIDYAGDIWKNKPWRFVMSST